MGAQVNHSHGPQRATVTHIALVVKDVDASIVWYERFTHLRVLARADDEDGRNVWLGDPERRDQAFILVLGQFYAGHDPFAPAAHPPMGPFAHIGIELPTREAVDAVAEAAREAGCLALGPQQMPKQIGYICFVKDPDNNTIEFSFDQGVYETAFTRWGVTSS